MIRAFSIIVGLVLLLPGACSLYFALGVLSLESFDPAVTFIWLVGIVLGLVGAFFIYIGISKRNSS